MLKGHEAMSTFLTDEHADMEMRTNDGLSALLLAAVAGNCNLVFLLQRGAKTDAKSINGVDALCMAASRGDEEMIGLLLNHQPEIDRQSNAVVGAASAGRTRGAPRCCTGLRKAGIWRWCAGYSRWATTRML